MSSPAHPRFVIEAQGPVINAHFEGQNIILGEEAATEAVEELSKLAGASVVLNLAGVIYLDSAALGKFVLLQKNLQVAGGRLVLCGLSPAVHDRFAHTRLDQHFDIRPGESPAAPG
jgi:anti-anti-sigma factor